MSLPEPRANPELFGHESAAATLAEAARSGRLHHAWLITGPAGIGKVTLAWRFARWLLAGMPDTPQGKPPLHLDATHPVFRRVAADSHADLLTIDADTLRGERKRNDINVEAARLIPGFMTLTAAEGGWRVVVVDGAETMNLQAQNAILKVLEEPPARAILLLVSSAPTRLCRPFAAAAADWICSRSIRRKWRLCSSSFYRICLQRIAQNSPRWRKAHRAAPCNWPKAMGWNCRPWWKNA